MAKSKKELNVNEYIEKTIKLVNIYVDENLSCVNGWEALGEDQIAHIKDVAKSIVLTRDNIMTGGGFVCAFIENDLAKVIDRADTICERSLKLFLLVKNNVKNI